MKLWFEAVTLAEREIMRCRDFFSFLHKRFYKCCSFVVMSACVGGDIRVCVTVGRLQMLHFRRRTEEVHAFSVPFSVCVIDNLTFFFKNRGGT